MKNKKSKYEHLKTHHTKEVYFICKYNGELDGITFKAFIEDFPNYVQTAEFSMSYLLAKNIILIYVTLVMLSCNISKNCRDMWESMI